MLKNEIVIRESLVHVPTKKSTSAKCNVNFQSQYAFFKDISKNLTIDEYLSGVKNIRPVCIQHKHELVAVRSTKRRSYFRHKNAEDVGGCPMTLWHAQWQGNFEVIEKIFRCQSGQTKERRADIVIPLFNRVVEIQHSFIEKSEIIERCDDYKLHNHSVVWIIDGSSGIELKTTTDGRQILFFRTDHWRYENFKSIHTVFYDIDNLIYKVNPSLIKSHMIDICQPKPKDQFIGMLQTDSSLWSSETEPFQSKLLIKQQGAGNGKTHGLMQMIDKDPTILHYKSILLITKQHSAAHVMYDEFINQYNSGQFSNIKDVEILEGRKKYIISYKLDKIEETRKIIIATVDSFMYAIGNKNSNSHINKFVSIVESIKSGHIETTDNFGAIRYAGVDPTINKEMLICIDEAQDLHERYGDALLRISTSMYADICLVGDLLQSIHYIHNAFSELVHRQLAFMKVIKTDYSNLCRRFNHPQLINFVNKLTPFEKYGLPHVTPAIVADSFSDSNAVILFQGENTNKSSGEEKENSIIKEVERIMVHFDKEVLENKRIPEDFMIVTPFTTQNALVDALTVQLNIYWKQKMEDSAYIEDVKKHNDYWKDVDPSLYVKYAIFHKSDEGNSIDLTESEHATRVVSIHSSKGDGRNVVFVIGISEDALKRFSQIRDNLIYDSLLHVAITRQKQRLYFRYEVNNDDICRRIQKIGVDATETPCSFIKFNSINTRINDIVNFVCIQDENEDFIGSTLVEKAAANSDIYMPIFNSDEKRIIDTANHCIRYASLKINSLIHVYNKEFVSKTSSDAKKQIWAKLYQVRPSIIKVTNTLKEHYAILKANVTEELRYIPLLAFPTNKTDVDYLRYFSIILSVMENICGKIQSSIGKTQLEYFCPLECIILFYMFETLTSGIRSPISINELYNIVHIYDRAFDVSATGHENCTCLKSFNSTVTKQSSCFQQYLCNHSERVAKLNIALSNFDISYPDVAWLYDHRVHFQGGAVDSPCYDFGIKTEFDLIAYNATSVHAFYIIPQYNELNYNKILVQTFFNEWLLNNIKYEEESKTYKYFSGKEMHHWVIALDQETAFEINWKNKITDVDCAIRNIVFNMLFKQFSVLHLQFYNYYMHLRKIHTPQKLIENVLANIVNLPSPPKYIDRFLTVIHGEIELQTNKIDRHKVLEKYDDLEQFIKILDANLEHSLKSFMNLLL